MINPDDVLREENFIAFELYLYFRFDSLRSYSVPEILRVPLEELCLHIMVNDLIFYDGHIVLNDAYQDCLLEYIFSPECGVYISNIRILLRNLIYNLVVCVFHCISSYGIYIKR